MHVLNYGNKTSAYAIQRPARATPIHRTNENAATILAEARRPRDLSQKRESVALAR